MLFELNCTNRCRKLRLLDKVFINIDDKKNKPSSVKWIKTLNED